MDMRTVERYSGPDARYYYRKIFSMNKTIVLGVLALLVLGGGGYYLVTKSSEVAPAPSAGKAAPTAALTPEVEKILADKMLLVSEIAKDPIILSTVKDESAKNATLKKEDIAALDAKWIAAKEADEFITKFMTNKGADALKAFQAVHPEFKEIFVTDVYGLNAAQTNKTSDYLQSDEEWWTKAFNGGTGASYHGSIEFDESAQTEAISIYVPIMSDGRVLGIVKAVLDLSAVKKAL
jgi:hypothetical protein